MMEELKGRKIFKISSVVTIIVGVVITVIGMFMISLIMNANQLDYSREVIIAQRFFTLGSVYVLACGIFYCYAGFFGKSNWNVEEEIKKQFVLGLILIGFAVVNIVIIIIIMQKITIINVLMAIIPLITSAAYFLPCIIDYRVLKMEEENEQ